MSLDSYNASYPLDYYEIGTCYAFYTSNDISYYEATQDVISQYAKKLDACKKENGSLISAEKVSVKKPYTRAIGIVVGKGSLDHRKYPNQIAVLFHDDTYEYIVKYYAVEGEEVITDNELVMAIKPGEMVDMKVPAYTKNMKDLDGGKPTTKSEPKSGPTVGKKQPKSGPTVVDPAGPTVVKESGPVKVEEAGPTVVK